MNGEAGTASIPASKDGAECLGGAAPGSGCRETGSTARSEALEAVSVGGGVRVVFVDFGNGKVYALEMTTKYLSSTVSKR